MPTFYVSMSNNPYTLTSSTVDYKLPQPLENSEALSQLSKRTDPVLSAASAPRVSSQLRLTIRSKATSTSLRYERQASAHVQKYLMTLSITEILRLRRKYDSKVTGDASDRINHPDSQLDLALWIRCSVFRITFEDSILLQRQVTHLHSSVLSSTICLRHYILGLKRIKVTSRTEYRHVVPSRYSIGIC